MGEHRARVAIRIGDAVEAALHVAGSLSGSGGALDRIRGVAGPHKAAEHTTGPSPGGASQSGECRAADPGLGVGPCGRPGPPRLSRPHRGALRADEQGATRAVGPKTYDRTFRFRRVAVPEASGHARKPVATFAVGNEPDGSGSNPGWRPVQPDLTTSARSRLLLNRAAGPVAPDQSGKAASSRCPRARRCGSARRIGRAC